MVNMGELGMLFRDFGRVLRIELRCATGSVLLSDGTRGGYYATVLFRSIMAATDALSLNGTIVSVHGGGYCKIKVSASSHIPSSVSDHLVYIGSVLRRQPS